jgi:hypothetical protein
MAAAARSDPLDGAGHGRDGRHCGLDGAEDLESERWLGLFEQLPGVS